MEEKRHSKKETRTNSAIHKLRNTKEGERKAQEERNRRPSTIEKA
jgi:hypothetical protein